MNYTRKKESQKQQNGVVQFFASLLAEFLPYITIWATGLFFGAVVAAYVFIGTGTAFLFLPLLMIVYYFFAKQPTPLLQDALQKDWLDQAHETQKILDRSAHNLEAFRVPLLKYCNAVVLHYSFELLEDVVLNLDEALKQNTFDVSKVPVEMYEDVRLARAEYLFSGKKIAECYVVLLAETALNREQINSIIENMFKSIALYEQNFITREDCRLANSLCKSC